MQPERLAAIDALFAEALELDGEARERLLAARGAADPELRAEVERLLAHAAPGVGALDLSGPIRSLIADAAASASDRPGAGETVGAYTLVRPLGEGGMGVVWLAARTDGTFEREVALKLLPGAAHPAAGGEAVKRFEQERQILARLAHPGIAHLLDGGVDRRGLPYLVMEHVDGRPIDAWCDERRSTLAERIGLVIESAAAVQDAHRNLVVHRDLKPSNVLVDTTGRVKLLDFGIAKLLDVDRTRELTATQARAMTPTYASPEQVNGDAITTAVDVYQLGLLLYELVTGHRPQEARTSSLSELVELVCRRDPPAPSRAVLAATADRSPEELAAVRRSTPAKLARQMRPELDAIVARALAKEPERRYPTPASLAADLERFLEGRPVQARRPSIAFRFTSWVRRNAALATVGAVAALALAGYAVTVTVQSRAIDRQRQRAELEAAKAGAVERFLSELFEASDPLRGQGRKVTAEDLVARGVERIDRELADQPAVQARLWSVLGQIQEQLGDSDGARRLLERALAAQLSHHGEDHPETALTLRRLGIVQRHFVDRQLGEQTLVRALAAQRRVLPPDSEELARTLEQLGTSRNFAGDSAAAVAYLQEALDIYRGKSSLAGVASTLTRLGISALNRGALDEAEASFREALELQRQLRGGCHPSIATNLFNLGAVLSRRGELEPALELMRQAAAIDADLYGADHSEVGIDLGRIADLEQRLGRLEKADALYAESLTILLARFGPSHLRVYEAQLGLGELRVRQKRYAEAEPLLGESIAARKRRLGVTHATLRAPLLWHGRALAGIGRRDEAIAIWREAEAIAPDATDELAGHLRRELEVAGGAPAAPAVAAATGVS